MVPQPAYLCLPSGTQHATATTSGVTNGIGRYPQFLAPRMWQYWLTTAIWSVSGTLLPVPEPSV